MSKTLNSTPPGLLELVAVCDVHETSHVGTLLAADRRHQYSKSYEGHCLSVSACPESWREIARLGCAPTWRLSNPGGRFVDVHKTLEQPGAREALKAWGMQSGLAEERTLWRAWLCDAETDRWGFVLREDYESACFEVCDPLELTDAGVPVVQAQAVTVGTEKLRGQVSVDLSKDDCIDFLLMAWAQSHLDADGLWWDEEHNVPALSAPRGGLFPSRLDRWVATPPLSVLA
jgi:hypothetical protein